MRLMKFCCCLPLRVGVIITGCLFGTMDLVLGSIGFYMVIKNDFPQPVHKFFDKMDTRTCVACFSSVFYLMSMNDGMLIYGAVRRKAGYMGPWLIVNFLVLICTIVTALLSPVAIIRI
ncbi:CG42493, partial [Drosophila busckii]